MRDPDESTYVLSRLRTPALTSTNVQIHSKDMRGWLNGLATPNSTHAINNLTIVGFKQGTSRGNDSNQVSTEVMMHVLIGIPRITHLTLEGVTFDAENLLASLRRLNRHVEVAPLLRTFELVKLNDTFDLETFLKYVMLRATRSRKSNQLKRINLKLEKSSPHNSNRYSRLLQLCRESDIVHDLHSLGIFVDIYRY
ncbi:hypothetical protein NMY22_g18367 [Coprinellus aureogranulatus]|nr:hypothetical protein NMY22_g18367 [Coprinellus aureogranulatus]